MDIKPIYLDPKEAAQLIGVSVQRLANLRHIGRGPDYIKIGSSIRYGLRDLQNYMDARKVRLQSNQELRGERDGTDN